MPPIIPPCIDDYIMEVLEKIEEAAVDNLPETGGKGDARKQNNEIAGWNESVKPFKNDALFWHSVWLSAGKPINTDLHSMMKSPRNLYH